MKKLKKIVALFTAALLCVLPIFTNSLTVQAEGNPTTYYVKYVDASSEWRFQLGSKWDDSSEGRELYYMYEGIKDGDLVVVDGNTDANLQFNVKLSNLTVVNSTLAIVSAKSIDDVYIINNSTAAVTGDVTNAYVYGAGAANFNSNVTNLYIMNTAEADDPDATINVLGTVAHVKATDKAKTYYEYYNFKANTFRTLNGNITTASENFSTTPTEASTPAAGTTTTTTTTPTTTPAAPSNDYDDVPKTGDTSVNPFFFLGIAAVCLLGSYELKKKAL